jgi:hypothetical protein
MEQLISDLLLRHNCVILPSFGGFVTRKTAATIDYVSGTMMPPRKSLLFNKQLVNNDGLLISQLAHHQNISYSEAEQIVLAQINVWNHDLALGNSIQIDKVGKLYFDQERNLCFEQDRFFNLLLDSYGLGKVHFLTETDLSIVKQEQTIEEKVQERIQKEISAPTLVPQHVLAEEVVATEINAPNFERVNVVAHPAIKKNSKAWKYIAASLLIPIAFYSFWIPTQTNVIQSGVITLQDFNPFHVSKTMENAAKLKEQTYIEPKADKQNVENNPVIEEVNTPIVEETPKEETPQVKAETIEPKVSKMSYDVVVGCFNNQANINTVIDFLTSKGLNPRIIEGEEGTKRVSAGTATSREAAKLIQQKSNEAGYPGWILAH